MEDLYLIIKNRDKVLFEGNINYMSSYNELGRFDVLKGHANFISLLSDKVIYEDVTGKVSTITLKDGIIKVDSNNVKVYLGISN